MFHVYNSLFAAEPIWCNVNRFQFACAHFMNNKFGVSYNVCQKGIRLIG